MAIDLKNSMNGDAFKAEVENALDKRGDAMDDGATLVLGKNPENDMEATPKKYVDNKVLINTYKGTGDVQTINLGLRPKAVYIVDAETGAPFIVNVSNSKNYYGGFVVDGQSKSHKTIEIVDTGFTVKNASGETGYHYRSNELNRQYSYIAWF